MWPGSPPQPGHMAVYAVRAVEDPRADAGATPPSAHVKNAGPHGIPPHSMPWGPVSLAPRIDELVTIGSWQSVVRLRRVGTGERGSGCC
jgi:hypothetical protein